MKRSLVLTHSISVALFFGLAGCSAQKDVEISSADQELKAAIQNLPNPEILDALKKFVGKQAIDAENSNQTLQYPSLKELYEGTNHLPDNLAVDMRDSICSTQDECCFFFDIGYSYKNGLAEEIKKVDATFRAMESIWGLDVNSAHNRLKTALGVQPYTDSVLKAYKSDRCNDECKDYLITGMKVILGVTNEVSRDSFDRINLNSEVALGRIKIVKKSEKEFVNLEPTEPVEYASVDPYNVPQEPISKPHNYQQKIQQQKVVRQARVPEPEVELVPNATGIVENLPPVHGKKIELKPTTYAEALSNNPTVESELKINKGFAPNLNIVDRKPQHKENSGQEYILIN